MRAWASKVEESTLHDAAHTLPQTTGPARFRSLCAQGPSVTYITTTKYLRIARFSGRVVEEIAKLVYAFQVVQLVEIRHRRERVGRDPPLNACTPAGEPDLERLERLRAEMRIRQCTHDPLEGDHFVRQLEVLHEHGNRGERCHRIVHEA